MHPVFRITAAAALTALLAACGSNSDLKESLGITHRAPDEFRVYQRPPLTVPPEFDLHPPGQGGTANEYTSGVPADVQAHNAVLGVTGTTATALPVPAVNVTGDGAKALPDVQSSQAPAAAVTAVSAGELPSTGDAQLLGDAGATSADPHIRQKIQEDTASGVKPAASKDSSYLLGGKSDADPTVDAAKEAARLKQDKDQNQPPTTGDTPTVDPGNKGILGGIF